MVDKDITLNERAQHLFKFLVERYIRDGQPVGSRTISDEMGIALSSASIRNVLADLEEQGYLRSLHTSSGRVPTSRGYRFFVDSLLTVQPLKEEIVQQFQQQLDPDLNMPSLVNSASTLLSQITQLAGLVTVPRHERIIVRHMEFLPLSGNRVLVILVFNEREVQNRIIYTDRPYSQNELQQAANYLNTNFAGLDLTIARQKIISSMAADRESMNTLMQTALDVASKGLNIQSNNNPEDYVMVGQTNLLGMAVESGVESLRSLFEAFTQKQIILGLLDHCLNAEGVQLYIGEESGFQALDDCSLVTAPYSVSGEVVGMLAVIGPTRMAYDKVIPIVDLTAKLLSAALNHSK